METSTVHRALAIAAVLACSDVATGMSPATLVQPTLAAHAATRATSLRDAGIERIVARSDRALGIYVLTTYGPSYAAWPAGVAPTSFELELDASDRPVVRAASDAGPGSPGTAALDAAIDAALRAADSARTQALRPRP